VSTVLINNQEALYDLSEVNFNPSGGLSNTSVQLALQELDNEKYDKTGGVISGNVFAQSYGIYNNYTDISNYEIAKVSWSSNILNFGTDKLGTGVARSLNLQTGGNTVLVLSSTGNITTNTSNSLLQFEGTSNTHPALKRNSSVLEVVLADNSGYAPIRASAVSADTVPANTSLISGAGYSITGTSDTPLLDFEGTWNTSGNPSLIKLNVTDTSSNANACLLEFQVNTSPKFKVTKDSGIIMYSPNGTAYKLMVSDAGIIEVSTI
jgi:hypothetical protein